MSTNIESDKKKPATSIPHVEIKNFELSLAFSQYMVSYDTYHYPIIMTPHEFLKLFETEGIPIESFTGDEPTRFTKVVLMRKGYTMRGDIYDEEGADCTPQRCWVKKNSMEA